VRYLLDTTLIADHAHGFAPAVALLRRLYEEGAELFTCDVVTCEALSGGTDDHLDAVARLLAPLEYVAISPEAARWAAASRLRRHSGWRQARPRRLADRRRSRGAGRDGDHP